MSDLSVEVAMTIIKDLEANLKHLRGELSSVRSVEASLQRELLEKERKLAMQENTPVFVFRNKDNDTILALYMEEARELSKSKEYELIDSLEAKAWIQHNYLLVKDLNKE